MVSQVAVDSLDPSKLEKEVDHEIVGKLYDALMKEKELSAEGREASKNLYREVMQCRERINMTWKLRAESMNLFRAAEEQLELWKKDFEKNDGDHSQAIANAQVAEKALSSVSQEFYKKKNQVESVNNNIQNSLTGVQELSYVIAARKRKLSITNPETTVSRQRKQKRQRHKAYVEDDPEANQSR